MTNDKDCAALLREALEALLRRDQINTCAHEDTHRGGFLWEICDSCGMKWADDEGGKPEWVDPPEWLAAEVALATLKSHEQAFDAAGVRDVCAKVAQDRVQHLHGSDLAHEQHRAREARLIADAIRALPIPEAPASVEPVADDVRRMVIAAREAWEVMGDCSADASYADDLDKALEAFSSRVPYVNEPDTIGSNFGNGGGLDPAHGFPSQDEWDAHTEQDRLAFLKSHYASKRTTIMAFDDEDDGMVECDFCGGRFFPCDMDGDHCRECADELFGEGHDHD